MPASVGRTPKAVNLHKTDRYFWLHLQYSEMGEGGKSHRQSGKGKMTEVVVGLRQSERRLPPRH